MSLVSNRSSQHTILLTQTTPNFAVIGIQLQYALQVLDGPRKILLCPQYTGYGIHCRDRLVVVSQGLFVGIQCTVQITHELGRASYKSLGQQ